MAALTVALAAFAFLYFQPQRLLYDDRVEEPPPAGLVVEPITGGTATHPQATHGPAPTTLEVGALRTRGHPSSGDVRLIRLPDGSLLLRLEHLRTENGPDLRLNLAHASADAPNDAFGRDYVSLGHLKGNIGDANYAVPAGVDLSHLRTVVIWCKRFSYAFATAQLTDSA